MRSPWITHQQFLWFVRGNSLCYSLSAGDLGMMPKNISAAFSTHVWHDEKSSNQMLHRVGFLAFVRKRELSDSLLHL